MNIITGQDWRVGPWICERAGGQWLPGMRTVGAEKDGELVAGVLYAEYNGVHCFVTIAAAGGSWLTPRLLWYIFRYPFIELKCRRLTALVNDDNSRSEAFVKDLGFSLESKLEGASPTGDILVFRMMKDDCRWLNLEKRYGQGFRATDA